MRPCLKVKPGRIVRGWGMHDSILGCLEYSGCWLPSAGLPKKKEGEGKGGRKEEGREERRKGGKEKK